MASQPSQNDLLLAILIEIRISNRLFAEQNVKSEELDKLRADAALIFPLLNTLTTPTGG